MANDERRNDVGQKVTYVALTAIISVLLTLIFIKTYQTAENAYAISCVNTTDIAVLKQVDKTFAEKLDTINAKLDQILKISVR